MKATRRPSSRIVAAIALIGAGPFLHQAVHVDDPFYLAIARNIAARPWDPMGGELLWHGGTTFGSVTNPPAWSYALAAVGWATNWNDVALHVLAALAYWGFVAGFARLAARTSDRPGFWTLAVAWSPFILPGRNLMLDMPMLALWVWSIEWQWRAVDNNRLRPALVAGLLAGLAATTKYTGLLLPGLLVAAAVLGRRPKALAALLPFGLLVGGWCLHNWWMYGTSHLVYHLGGAGVADRSKYDAVDRLRILFRNVGSVLMWGPAFAFAFVDGKHRRWSVAAGGLFAAVGAGWFDYALVDQELSNGGLQLMWLHATHYAVFTASGLFAFAMFAALMLRSATPPGSTAVPSAKTWRLFLATWLLLGLAFNLFALSKVAFGAIRHLQTFLVPAMLLAAGPIDAAWNRRWGVRLFAWLAMAVGAIVAFGLCAADLEAANTHRRFALEELPTWTARGKTWFVGDLNVRYYAERTAALPLEPGKAADEAKLKVGDFVVFPLMQWFGAYDSPLRQRSKMLEARHIDGRVPLHTIDIQVNFYGGSRTSLPWLIPLTYEVTGTWLRPTITPPEQVVVYQLMR